MSAEAERGVAIRFSRFESSELDAGSLKSLQEKIGETEDRKIRCLKTLTEKLKELKDVEPCLDENFLLRFLRMESFDTSKAFDRINKAYNMHEELLEMFGKNRAIPRSLIQDMPYLCALPYRLEDHSALLLVRMGVPDLSRLTFDEKCYLDLIVMDKLMRNPLSQLCGVSIILDWSGFRLLSLLAFKPLTLLRLMNHLMNTLPLLIKEFHVVNFPSALRILFYVLYPIFPKELRSRVFFHQDDDGWESLHSFISPQILPEEYGGYLKTTSRINLLERAEELDRQFREGFKFGYVDTKIYRMSLRLIP